MRVIVLVSWVVALCVSGSVAAAATTERTPPKAAIASAHPLATKAGYAILEQGGNAFDAAVAVSAALGVVEPYSSGLGGGGFYLLHEASSGNNVFLDGRERATLAATQDMYLDEQGNVQWDEMRRGVLAAGIPGIPAALAHMSKNYGNLPLAQSLAPAIKLAREGFRVDPRLALVISESEELLRKYCAKPCPFFINGEPPETGDVLKQPELAATLERFAAGGRDGFYTGKTARLLIDAVQEAGGLWTQEDFDQYKVIEREPLTVDLTGAFEGYRVITAVPPSSGGIVLIETLNILSGFNLFERDEVTRKHLIVEAWRRAYRDRGEYIGDPAFVDVPVKRLTSPYYAAGLRAGIRLDRATPSSALPMTTTHPEGQHTTHFSIIDAEGNRVAATQTINYWFGSGVVPAGTGVVLNNELFDFVPKPGVPDGFGLVSGTVNTVAPGKRPTSSMTPTFIESDRGVAILGTPGGSRIISMVALATLDYMKGGTAASMVSRPRFHHQYLPDVIQFEKGALEPEIADGLRALGHEVKELDRRYGNMNVVVWDYSDDTVEAATDPRNEAYVEF